MCRKFFPSTALYGVNNCWCWPFLLLLLLLFTNFSGVRSIASYRTVKSLAENLCCADIASSVNRENKTMRTIGLLSRKYLILKLQARRCTLITFKTFVVSVFFFVHFVQWLGNNHVKSICSCAFFFSLCS